MIPALASAAARHFRQVVGVGLVLCASVVFVPAARAQFGGGGFGGPDGMFSPPVSGRDLDRYAEVLSLTEDQKEAAEALMEGYRDSYQQQARAMRDRMDAARESRQDGPDRGSWDEMRKGFEELRATRTRIEQSFQSDLQSVLTPEQMALWPRAEREVRRERLIGRGLMSGERVDVVEITKDVAESLPEPDRKALLDAAAPTLEQYSVDLDRALVARNQVFEEGMNRAGDMMAGGDMNAMQALFDKGRQAGEQVREINQRYARQVEAVVPEASRPAFADAVRRASFPEVYRENYGAKVLDAAKGLTDLDENQRAGVQAIAEGYARELAAVNDKMAAAIVDREKNFTVRDMFRRGRGGLRGQESEDLYRTRRDLEESTLANLKKLLTPEQSARLPEREERGLRDRGGRGRDAGNDGANQGPRRRTF